LGGGGATSPQPKQLCSGNKRKKQLSNVFFASGTAPSPKQPRKQQSQNLDSDYQQFLQWKKNPYWKPNGTSNPPPYVVDGETPEDKAMAAVAAASTADKDLGTNGFK
jgi:hypothetical protein